jgi:hypothetical protein
MLEKFQNKKINNLSQSKKGENKKKFFDALPNSFKRKETVEIGQNFDIGERSVGNFLKLCVGKYLQQSEYGAYTKIKC